MALITPAAPHRSTAAFGRGREPQLPDLPDLPVNIFLIFLNFL